jgi:hypothetical protein
MADPGLVTAAMSWQRLHTLTLENQQLRQTPAPHR